MVSVPPPRQVTTRKESLGHLIRAPVSVIKTGLPAARVIGMVPLIGAWARFVGPSGKMVNGYRIGP